MHYLEDDSQGKRVEIAVRGHNAQDLGKTLFRPNEELRVD
jgi:hypothetical protein